MIIECLISLVSHVSDALMRAVVVNDDLGNYSLKAIMYWC